MQPLKHSVRRRFEFHFPNLDNDLLLEVCDEDVTIRAARDNFSDRRKDFFVRELAAEGYVADDCISESVDWVIDSSWLAAGPRQRRRADRFMRRLFLGSALLWVSLMASVLVFNISR